MSLPASFARDGFVMPEVARKKAGAKFRRLMISSEGLPNTGKTEFLLSAPGPGLVIVLDRGFDAMFDNPTPPPTRHNNYAFHVVTAPVNTQAVLKTYQDHWLAFYKKCREALRNEDARTIGIDGDSDSWELQRLAEHGALTGIFPQTKFTTVYAARRGFYNELWDSGKIVIATNKVKESWRTVKDEAGNPVLNSDNTEKRERSGEHESQGFPDRGYLWSVQLRHLYQGPTTVTNKITHKTRIQGARWGIEILDAKANTSHQGTILWGEDCSFSSLVQLIYPQVPLTDWGF